ncbi:TIGR04222 domain-containing membrane protein [Kitasatospora sp. NBC_01300]|uniref:TIGR04222 domain-containing membrane protein n=1 Tax=Kitasatospora sp. NBC_01300 TaxID=2903574 RepID=UPI00352F300A|nr:TIGR04222 domain-containing membrane protein [Kitasatospora sp. NBC_01300]
MWHNTYFVVPAVLLVAASLYASRTKQRVGHVPRVQGLPGRGLPLMDTAFLSGGPGRVFDTALIRMHLSERAVISRAGLVTLTGHKPYDAVDQAVLDAVGPGRSRELAPLRRAVMRSAAVQEIGDRLADRGLMRHPERLRRARTARRLLWLALLGVAVSTVLAYVLDDGGAGSDRPAPWVPVVLLVFGVISLLVTWPAKGRITPAGRRQLSLMKVGTPWTPSAGLSPKMTGGALLGALALGGLAAAGLEDDELQSAMLAAAAQDEAMKSAAASSYASSSTGSSSSFPPSSCSSSGSSCGGSTAWCGSSHSGSSGCGGSSSSCGSSSSSCGSGSSSCGSSSSSCGSSSSSCGSSSSSCGGGGGCGS